MAKLGISLKKLQKGLLLGKRSSSCVKQGHFAVIAEYGEEPRRFIIPLTFLTHPRFLKLLEKAAEEYGFNHEGGALTVPCHPIELETILSDQQWQEQGDSSNNVSSDWCFSEPSMVRSY